MVALPARPAPMAAPMAPPPRASPPPIRAPAMAIAWFIDFLLSVGSGLHYCRWFGLRRNGLFVRPLSMLLGALDGLAEIDDREQEEGERLQRADEEYVNDLPAGHQHHGQAIGHSRDREERQHDGEHPEHDHASEDVAH